LLDASKSDSCRADNGRFWFMPRRAALDVRKTDSSGLIVSRRLHASKND
jgi:hypothetical protein